MEWNKKWCNATRDRARELNMYKERGNKNPLHLPKANIQNCPRL